MKIHIEKIPTPAAKRLFDITFSCIMMALLFPIILLILLCIFFEHILRCALVAPLFYLETRISQGEPFKLVKFNIFNPRILRELKSRDAFIHTKDLEKQKSSLIVVGKFLKQIYLDELPQLWNVLKGDISLVGPRPVNMNVYKKRFLEGDVTKMVIKAGITGSFQSQKGHYKKSDKELDTEYIEYVKNNPGWKVVLRDIKIIVKTIKVILKAEGI